MKNYFKIIDNFICNYLGVTKQELTPSLLKIDGKKISIISVESFKRHSYTKKIDDFILNKIEHLNEINKTKLGSAVGKAIAKNLRISFDNIEIKKDNV